MLILLVDGDLEIAALRMECSKAQAMQQYATAGRRARIQAGLEIRPGIGEEGIDHGDQILQHKPIY